MSNESNIEAPLAPGEPISWADFRDTQRMEVELYGEPWDDWDKARQDAAYEYWTKHHAQAWHAKREREIKAFLDACDQQRNRIAVEIARSQRSLDHAAFEQAYETALNGYEVRAFCAQQQTDTGMLCLNSDNRQRLYDEYQREAARLDAEAKVVAEKAEQQRLERERLAKEAEERETKEKERRRQQREQRKAERERQEAEHAAKETQEQERLGRIEQEAERLRAESDASVVSQETSVRPPGLNSAQLKQVLRRVLIRDAGLSAAELRAAIGLADAYDVYDQGANLTWVSNQTLAEWSNISRQHFTRVMARLTGENQPAKPKSERNWRRRPPPPRYFIKEKGQRGTASHYFPNWPVFLSAAVNCFPEEKSMGKLVRAALATLAKASDVRLSSDTKTKASDMRHESLRREAFNASDVRPHSKQQRSDSGAVVLTPASASAPGATATAGTPGESEQPKVGAGARAAADAAEGFNELWEAYAKKEGRKQAQRGYNATLAKGVSHRLLVEQAKHYTLAKGHLLNKAESQKFFKTLANWLRDETYLDAPTIPQPSQAKGGKAVAGKRKQKTKATTGSKSKIKTFGTAHHASWGNVGLLMRVPVSRDDLVQVINRHGEKRWVVQDTLSRFNAVEGFDVS